MRCVSQVEVPSDVPWFWFEVAFDLIFLIDCLVINFNTVRDGRGVSGGMGASQADHAGRPRRLRAPHGGDCPRGGGCGSGHTAVDTRQWTHWQWSGDTAVETRQWRHGALVGPCGSGLPIMHTHPSMPHSDATPLHSTPLHSTPLYSTPLHSTRPDSTRLYTTPIDSNSDSDSIGLDWNGQEWAWVGFVS